MKLSIDEDDVDQLLHGAARTFDPGSDGYEAVVRVSRALGRAQVHRDHPTDYLVVAESGALSFAHEVDHPGSRWDAVRPAVTLIAALVSTEPGAIGHADTLGAYVRDTFDAFGLAVTDEDATYTALVVAGLMVELAHNGLATGATTPEAVAAIAHIAQSLAAALIPHLPPEARL